MANKREVRSLVAELRAEGRTITGYAAKFNTLSGDLGGFFEQIAPGAFDLANSHSVILNYDHDDQSILGRTESGTLKLTQDDIGLLFECELPAKSPKVDVDGLIELISRGDLRGCSFAFTVADDGDEWSTTDDGQRLRTLTKVVLYDVCVTPCPAYLDTEVAMRRLDVINARDALALCRQRLMDAEKRLRLQQLNNELHR